MGYEKNLLKNLDKIIAEENDEQISSFADALRSNLSKTAGLTLKSTAFSITMIMSHYLVSNGFVEKIELGSNSVNDSPFLRTVLLISALLGLLAMVLSDYMMRCYRETLDYLLIRKKSKFTSTGLHDLTIPASYFMGLDLLRNDTTHTGKILANVLGIVINIVLISFPLTYLLIHFIQTLKTISKQPFYGLAGAVGLMVILIVIPLLIYKSSRLSNPKLVWKFHQNSK